MGNLENNAESISQESLKAFAKRARELRQERGLTLESLGNFLGYSRSAISSYECLARTPDIKVLKAYSDFFDVPVDYLIGKINMRKPLHAIACFSNLTDEDVDNWSKDVQEDISNFIEFRLQQEKHKKENK